MHNDWELFGEWARRYSVSRVELHADGNVRCIEFAPAPIPTEVPDLPEADDREPSPRKIAFNKALTRLTNFSHVD